jgi:hypothetical protein
MLLIVAIGAMLTFPRPEPWRQKSGRAAELKAPEPRPLAPRT